MADELIAVTDIGMANITASGQADDDSQNDNFVRRVRDILIGSQFSLIRLLGAGSFGKVYLGQDREGQLVAIKLEHHKIYPSFLGIEVEVYESLADFEGFPDVYWHGEQDDFRCMVMELLGPNLEDLLQYCGGKFSLKTTLMLADQLLQRLKTLHDHDCLHRDIKPENFLLGTGTQGNTVYMTDLGLGMFQASNYDRGEVTQERQHTSSRACEPRLVGTCRYASIQGHFGGATSRYDDLEAVGYMLIYFCKGGLPWQGLPDRPKEIRYRKVVQLKQEMTTAALCEGLPRAFRQYMEYVRAPRPDRVPSYKYLRSLFSELFQNQGFEMDNVFDWTILKFQEVSGNLPQGQLV